MEHPESYWREVYLNHARTGGYKRRVQQAKDRFAEMLDKGLKYQVNVSGGKDSLALWHISQQQAASVAVNYVDDLLDEHALVYANLALCAERFGWGIGYVRDAVSIWAQVEAVGAKTTDYRGEFERADIQRMIAQQNAAGIECVVMGMRAQESKGRRINYALRGHIYQNKGAGYWVSQPLVSMAGADVFAYLFEHDVPIPPLYWWTKYVEDPTMVRVDWLLPLESNRQQQHAWVKHYFPEVWNRLCQINPMFRSYV